MSDVSEVGRLKEQLEALRESMYDAQDSLALERAERDALVQQHTVQLTKQTEEFKAQITFKTEEIERQKQANRKLERKVKSIASSAVSSNVASTQPPLVLKNSSFALPPSNAFPNRNKRKPFASGAWPEPGRKKGKMTESTMPAASSSGSRSLPPPPAPSLRGGSHFRPPSSSSSSSSGSSSGSSTTSTTSNTTTTTTTTTNTTTVRTNHMWAQQREASRALTGHLSGAVKILLGSAGYVEANASAVGRSWSSSGMTGGRAAGASSRGISSHVRSSTGRPRTSSGSSSSSSSSSSGGRVGGVSSSSGREARLARDLRDGADALYKCLMDLIAEQEREIEATGAPLFALTASALRFLCIKDVPPSIEEAALSVVRLLVATTYKRGSKDVVRSGDIREEEVSDQLRLTIHVAVTKVRSGARGGVIERALGLLNMVLAIDMGTREREKLLLEIGRLVRGGRWQHQWELRGTEVVNLICQLGGAGKVFMKIEGVRSLVVAVSKAVFRERGSTFLWRQISIVRMMVRFVGKVGDRMFWSLLRGTKAKEEEHHPLLGDMVGLLKRKIQERAGLVRREQMLWLGSTVHDSGMPTSRIVRSDRESASSLEELLIMEGLKMLEKVDILSRRSGSSSEQSESSATASGGATMAGTIIVGRGRLSEETSSLYKMAKEMGMTDHLLRSSQHE